MTTAPDVAADAFQMELDGILRGLVQTVNQEAADIVAQALEPTAESHHDLKSAAESARVAAEDAGALVTALKDAKGQLSATLSKTETLNGQLEATIEALEKKWLAHDQAMQTRVAKIDESVRGHAAAILVTIVTCSLVLLGTVIGLS